MRRQELTHKSGPSTPWGPCGERSRRSPIQGVTTCPQGQHSGMLSRAWESPAGWWQHFGFYWMFSKFCLRWVQHRASCGTPVLCVLLLTAWSSATPHAEAGFLRHNFAERSETSKHAVACLIFRSIERLSLLNLRWVDPYPVPLPAHVCQSQPPWDESLLAVYANHPDVTRPNHINNLVRPTKIQRQKHHNSPVLDWRRE